MPQVNEFSWLNKFIMLNFFLSILLIFLSNFFNSSFYLNSKKLEKFNFFFFV